MPSQHRSVRFVVEIEGRGVGVLVAQRTGYKYFAADHSTARLDGRSFATPSQAQNAVSALCRPQDPDQRQRTRHG
ncbi:MAG: hypothetical protein QNJ30_13720 [Kiloniellales bacterium]|nr:hypothetical protein [Kiloniellales bacterium]